MNKITASGIAIGIHPITGDPYAAEVVDSTLWPSERATRQALETLVEIHNQGYAGLRLEHWHLKPNETLFSRCVNMSTPEGRLVTFVMELAERGRAFSTEEALRILKKIYLSEGLTPPTPRPISEQICVSESKA
ncbi:hypothetical protein [Limnohabitans sp. 2KL-51]|uniref:hypothetical protein n=1 Tax=Limnohabitans sp. 2KL-51 TaxID=1977911 RepID=UPI0011B25975|nr:hypothetical protein [Limnohabitans sp. 2KL-51]